MLNIKKLKDPCITDFSYLVKLINELKNNPSHLENLYNYKSPKKLKETAQNILMNLQE